MCGVDVVVVLVIFLNSLFEDKDAFSLSLDYKSCFNFDHKVYTQSPLKFCFLKEGIDIRIGYLQDSPLVTKHSISACNSLIYNVRKIGDW